MFEILEADIVIMQEVKIQRKDLRDDMVLVPGWDVFFSLPKHKKGEFESRNNAQVRLLTKPKDTLVWPFILATLFALQSGQKKASLAFLLLQTLT